MYGEVVMDEIADSFIDEDFFEDYIQSSAHAGEFDLSLETIEEELDELFDDVRSSEIGRSPEAVRAESRQILVTHPVQFVPRYPFQRKKMPVEQSGDTILEK